MIATPKVHYCGHKFCRNIVPLDQRYCPEHLEDGKRYANVSRQQKLADNKRYDLFQRDAKANSFYHSSQWTQLRNYIVAKDMNTCAVCGNVIDDTKIVDHIVPLRVDSNLKLNKDNLWVLCKHDHNLKTKLEEQILTKPNGTNIIKHMSKENWIKYIKERR